MQQECGYILAPQALTGKKTFRQILDPIPDEFRHVLGEDDMEAGIAQIETHRGKRIRKQETFRCQYARSGRFSAGDDHARSAIAAYHAREYIGLRAILALL